MLTNTFVRKHKQDVKGYVIHLGLNILVSFKCIVYAVFHLVHGLIPIKWTSHEHWNI